MPTGRSGAHLRSPSAAGTRRCGRRASRSGRHGGRQPRSWASRSIVSTAARACETGQPFLAASAASWKALRPGRVPIRGSQLDPLDREAVVDLVEVDGCVGFDAVDGRGRPCPARPTGPSRSSRRGPRRSAPRGSCRRPPRSGTGTSRGPRRRRCPSASFRCPRSASRSIRRWRSSSASSPSCFDRVEPKDRAQCDSWTIRSPYSKRGSRRPAPSSATTPTRWRSPPPRPDGAPSARMVLLKGVDERGLVFFTNYSSRKGDELEQNPRAALLFHWQPLGRQVRVEGPVSRVDRAEGEAYARSRPRQSQLSALASPRARWCPTANGSSAAWRSWTASTRRRELPVGEHWGGFRVEPESLGVLAARRQPPSRPRPLHPHRGRLAGRAARALERGLQLHHLLQPASWPSIWRRMSRRANGRAKTNASRAIASSAPASTVCRTRVPLTSSRSSSVLSKCADPETARRTCRRGGVLSVTS